MSRVFGVYILWVPQIDVYTPTLEGAAMRHRNGLGGILFRPLLGRCWCGICDTADRNTVGDLMEAHGEGVVDANL
jgi:hypothetical protein